jgi:hypothetical protein
VDKPHAIMKSATAGAEDTIAIDHKVFIIDVKEDAA